MKSIITPIIVMLLIAGCAQKETESTIYRLWYDEPATEWTEALPVGNGRMGAMIFGDPKTERIQFNEESLWAGSKIDNNNSDALENLPKIQELIFEGNYQEAYALSRDKLLGTPPNVRSHQTMGDLLINYHWKGDVDNYQRELILNSGIASTTFDVDDMQISQEVFSSAPANLIAVHISATKPFDVDLELSRQKDAVINYTTDGEIIMVGQIIDEENPNKGPAGAHMKFSAVAKAINEGGQLDSSENKLTYKSIRSLTIYLTGATDYDINQLDVSEKINPLKICNEILNLSVNKPFDTVIDEHIKDHRKMFERVDLSFGIDSLQNLPTDERLNLLKEGNVDNGLVASYFQYGRYLLMGSSREPGVLPANLQGLWNEHFNAPWNADFHTNINLQMNYWPAEVCNLSETSLVLAGFMDKLTLPGTVTANSMYGTEGWTLHHLTDPFGRTGVADGVWGITPLDGPWMTFPLYRHYEFTGDIEYLKNIYPVLKGSADFIKGFLIESPEGYLVTNPSHSPENAFFVPNTDKKERSSLTYAATTDIQIINELFGIIIKSSDLLNIDKEYALELAALKKRLPPVQIGDNGTIQEWIHDYEEVEVGHRHMSHLLGLYPLSQITEDTPELYDAARKTIQRRLQSGGGHTGWSRAWIVNFYARFKDGEEAWNHLQMLLAKSTKTNLFDNHPPFQIDGNFGGTAGIAEMLLQSHNGTIHLLPALPKAWSEGHVTGLKARGGFSCDIWWENGILTKAVIHSKNGGIANIKYGSDEQQVDIEPGGQFNYELPI